MSPSGQAPRVSVVVPAYNYARFLPRAIDSVFAQDYPSDRIEIVVVDDGSTDATPEVLARYGDRIRVERQPNQGVSAATARGFELATGDLLTLLGADDVFPRSRVARMVQVLADRPEVGLVYGDMAIVDERGKVLEPSFRRAAGVEAHEGRVLGRLLLGNFVSGGALMVRATHKAQLLPFPAEAAYEDWWIACAVARSAPIAAIDDVVLHYRSHGANANLAAHGRKHIALLKSELPFRRRLLLDTDLRDDVSADDLVAALGAFDGLARAVARVGEDVLLDVDREAALVELHAASDALDAADVDTARMRLVRAATQDPSFDLPRELLLEIERSLRPERVGAGG